MTPNVLGDGDSGETSHGQEAITLSETCRHQVRQISVSLCERCIQSLSADFSHRCLACGASRLIPARKTSVIDAIEWVDRCDQCRRIRLQFSRCFSIGNYEQGLREAILKIKAGTHDALINDFARILAAQIEPAMELDVVIPIPTHWTRRLVKRTVVAEVLAENISRQLGKPCYRRLLRCCQMTQKQGTLSTTERIHNVKGAFHLIGGESVRGKNLLIVDDVMTSGATLNEAAQTCLAAGANFVGVAVIARGVGRSQNRSQTMGQK